MAYTYEILLLGGKFTSRVIEEVISNISKRYSKSICMVGPEENVFEIMHQRIETINTILKGDDFLQNDFKISNPGQNFVNTNVPAPLNSLSFKIETVQINENSWACLDAVKCNQKQLYPYMMISQTLNLNISNIDCAKQSLFEALNSRASEMQECNTFEDCDNGTNIFGGHIFNSLKSIKSSSFPYNNKLLELLMNVLNIEKRQIHRKAMVQNSSVNATHFYGGNTNAHIPSTTNEIRRQSDFKNSATFLQNDLMNASFEHSSKLKALIKDYKNVQNSSSAITQQHYNEKLRKHLQHLICTEETVVAGFFQSIFLKFLFNCNQRMKNSFSCKTFHKSGVFKVQSKRSPQFSKSVNHDAFFKLSKIHTRRFSKNQVLNKKEPHINWDKVKERAKLYKINQKAFEETESQRNKIIDTSKSQKDTNRKNKDTNVKQNTKNCFPIGKSVSESNSNKRSGIHNLETADFVKNLNRTIFAIELLTKSVSQNLCKVLTDKTVMLRSMNMLKSDQGLDVKQNHDKLFVPDTNKLLASRAISSLEEQGSSKWKNICNELPFCFKKLPEISILPMRTLWNVHPKLSLTNIYYISRKTKEKSQSKRYKYETAEIKSVHGNLIKITRLVHENN